MHLLNFFEYNITKYNILRMILKYFKALCKIWHNAYMKFFLLILPFQYGIIQFAKARFLCFAVIFLTTSVIICKLYSNFRRLYSFQAITIGLTNCNILS